MIISLPPAPVKPALVPDYQHSMLVTATAPAAPAEADTDPAQAQLQIGDFTLGDTDCPSLTGHPDIRY